MNIIADSPRPRADRHEIPEPAAQTWKQALRGRLRPEWAREIDIFETQIELRKLGKLDEKVFAETRLRRGVYGQRYDNGQRHDGTASKILEYPCGALTKGPATVWDAPGMQRIKVPMGRLTAAQLEVLCDLAEEYSDQNLARDDASRHPIAFRPHRGHARPNAPPGSSRDHHARGLRQCRAQYDGLPI